jgi:hypothetical protein
MEGQLNTCTLTSKNFDYTEVKKELENKYGFEKIGEGGFGVVLGAKGCAIKIIKDIKRCDELVNDKPLMGRIPKYNLFKQLSTYCQFNTERILSPLSEFDDLNDKTRVGYVIGEEDDVYIFKDLKEKRGIYNVAKSKVYIKSNRKIIHFYVNHYDVNYKFQSEDRGNIFGINQLITNFSNDKVQEYSFALGQLVSFIILDCNIYPFDVECVIGTNNTSRECFIYMYDFNECQFMDNVNNLNHVALLAAKALYNKDGKHYFPNNKNIFYRRFVDGMCYTRDDNQKQFINQILDYYNNFFTG